MTADEIINDILRREGSEYTNRRTLADSRHDDAVTADTGERRRHTDHIDDLDRRVKE